LTFDALFVPDALREAVSDEAWLAGMLEAERALAAAQGIELELGDLDVAELVEEGRKAGNPVEPLARHLRERNPQAHRGATSQDILDTAAALVARNATRLIEGELDGVAAACARLAEEHRTTVMAGRTLLQQAVPITFGLKAAGWLVGVVHARKRLGAANLPAQLGGAAGTARTGRPVAHAAIAGRGARRRTLRRGRLRREDRARPRAAGADRGGGGARA
jgi:3-carboxy-cis,cis-muconate cycloisomerase